MHIVMSKRAKFKGSTGRKTRHEQYEMHYFLCGNGDWQFADRHTQITPYLLTFTPQNCFHRAIGSDFQYYFVRFLPSDASDQDLIDRFRSTLTDGYTTHLNKQFQRTFETIRQHSQATNEDLKQAGAYLFCSLLHELIGSQSQKSQVNPAVAKYVPQAMRLIEHHSDTKMNLDDIAATVGISKPYLIRLFKQFTGTTPTAYHLQLKMESAAYLLRESTLSIQEIAHQLEFYDEFYFSRYFKKHHGTSPSAFRNAS